MSRAKDGLLAYHLMIRLEELAIERREDPDAEQAERTWLDQMAEEAFMSGAAELRETRRMQRKGVDAEDEDNDDDDDDHEMEVIVVRD